MQDAPEGQEKMIGKGTAGIEPPAGTRNRKKNITPLIFKNYLNSRTGLDYCPCPNFWYNQIDRQNYFKFDIRMKDWVKTLI